MLNLNRPVSAFHIGRYWRKDNDTVYNIMGGLRNSGATVFEFDTDDYPKALDDRDRRPRPGSWGPTWIHWDQIQPLVENFAPDLIICNAGGFSFTPEVAASLKTRYRLLGIALSDPNLFDQCTGRIAPNFHLFLTNDETCLPRYQALGVEARLLAAATNERHFRPLPPRPEYRCDVLMMGRVHSDRLAHVQALMDNFDVHLYGEGWEKHGFESRGLIFGEESLAALGSASMTVVLLTIPTGERIPKISLFDFPAAGALVATNYVPAVERYFTYGKELIGFHSPDDLVAQVRYYLDHPGEAEAIRQAGRTRVLKDYTWSTHWPRILFWLSDPSKP